MQVILTLIKEYEHLMIKRAQQNY